LSGGLRQLRECNAQRGSRIAFRDINDNAASAEEPKLQDLPSEAIGTKVGELVSGCVGRHARAAHPPPPPRKPAFALALSGGGFRATLASIGVLRFLADAGLLERVRYVSSVSGGSIANGVFAVRYRMLEKDGFSTESFVELVEAPVVQRITSASLAATVVRNLWRAVAAPTRTTVLADKLDDWFFEGCALSQLSSNCRFIFNAANLTTGVRFGFERDVIGDWVVGNVSTKSLGIRVADAVAASAAVPGFFAPYTPKVAFPCQEGRVPKIVDGGAYENTGLEPVDHLDGDEACLGAMNAGGIFRTGPFGKIPILRDLMRSEALLYRQSTALRARSMVEAFKAWEDARRSGIAPPRQARRGVLFGLATTLEGPTPDWDESGPRPERKDLRLMLATLPTSLGQFPIERARELVYRGWWLTGAALSKFHPDLVPPGAAPVWQRLV
jgi:NTE family protein